MVVRGTRGNRHQNNKQEKRRKKKEKERIKRKTYPKVWTAARVRGSERAERERPSKGGPFGGPVGPAERSATAISYKASYILDKGSTRWENPKITLVGQIGYLGALLKTVW